MYRLGHAKVNIRSSRQSSVFLQPRQVRRHRVSSWHHRFKLVIALLVGQHHAAQMEVNPFGNGTRCGGVIETSLVRLPDFDEGIGQAGAAVRAQSLARYD
jgi:hypothetical protein